MKRHNDGTYILGISRSNGTWKLHPVKHKDGYQVGAEVMYGSFRDVLTVILGEFPKNPHGYPILGDTEVGVYNGAYELSDYITDLETAKGLGHARNQYSIWDWANMCEIVLNPQVNVEDQKS